MKDLSSYNKFIRDIFSAIDCAYDQKLILYSPYFKKEEELNSLIKKYKSFVRLIHPYLDLTLITDISLLIKDSNLNLKLQFIKDNINFYVTILYQKLPDNLDAFTDNMLSMDEEYNSIYNSIIFHIINKDNNRFCTLHFDYYIKSLYESIIKVSDIYDSYFTFELANNYKIRPTLAYDQFCQNSIREIEMLKHLYTFLNFSYFTKTEDINLDKNEIYKFNLELFNTVMNMDFSINE